MTSPTETQPPATQSSSAWWRYGHVWLILGLLTFAIVASCGLLYEAIKINATDKVYSDPRHPQDGSQPRVTNQASQLPAEEARNHAQTGGVGARHLQPSPQSGTASGQQPASD